MLSETGYPRSSLSGLHLTPNASGHYRHTPAYALWPCARARTRARAKCRILVTSSRPKVLAPNEQWLQIPEHAGLAEVRLPPLPCACARTPVRSRAGLGARAALLRGRSVGADVLRPCLDRPCADAPLRVGGSFFFVARRCEGRRKADVDTEIDVVRPEGATRSPFPYAGLYSYGPI